MSTAPRAFDTGQPSFASRAACSNAASSIPSTSPRTVSRIDVIRKPPSAWSRVQTASVSSRVGACPAWARPFARAIDTHVACAAAISSSGLVLPPESGSKREAKVTGWPVTAPLLVRSNCPLPLRRSPSHVAWARRSIAIPLLRRQRLELDHAEPRARGECHAAPDALLEAERDADSAARHADRRQVSDRPAQLKAHVDTRAAGAE